MTGKIHSIDTFGTVDGPGIRFLLFMQGCPLSCKYCHNKDATITGLGEDKTPEEIIKEVVKYKNYYKTGGGLTVTGGEPFYQPEFLYQLLKLAKENDIHTCIDTSGAVDIAIADPILDYTDLVLLDIKHMDFNECVNLTGQTTERALLLAQHLNQRNIPMWIRYVLVPGITDNTKDLLDLGRFLNTLDNIEQFDIMQYHTLGAFKWKKLGLDYPLDGVREATSLDELRAISIIREEYKK